MIGGGPAPGMDRASQGRAPKQIKATERPVRCSRVTGFRMDAWTPVAPLCLAFEATKPALFIYLSVMGARSGANKAKDSGERRRERAHGRPLVDTLTDRLTRETEL